MKFKVGDKVRVVKRATASWSKTKDNYIGKVFTIDMVAERDDYPYSLSATGYWWCDEELELAQFTKSDLKDGMVVEYCNGQRRVVLNNRVMASDISRSLDNHNEDLIDKYNDDYTIDKVYHSSAHTLNEYFKDNCLTLIWERPKEEPVKEMTVEEIEKELGYKVKIIADKDN